MRRQVSEQDVFQNEQGDFAKPIKYKNAVSLYENSSEQLLENKNNSEEILWKDCFDENINWENEMKKPINKKINSKKSKKRINSFHPWKFLTCMGVIVLSLIASAILYVLLVPQLKHVLWVNFPNVAFINGEIITYDKREKQTYEQAFHYVYRDTIYPGVFVDNTHVGDYSIKEAKEEVEKTNSIGQPFSVTVGVGNRTWTLDENSIPTNSIQGDTLQKAFAVGRQFTNATPNLMQHFDKVVKLRTAHQQFLRDRTYNESAIAKKVEQIATEVSSKPEDAQIESFDYQTRTFTFTDGRIGYTLDKDNLHQQILQALKSGETNKFITAKLIETKPTITKDMLAQNFNLMGAYVTETTTEKTRNTNIDLACRTINGTALMPGEVFSFNEVVGQRTREKGYQVAGAIAAGQNIKEVGGGICQVSSTLFNAVARANLEIVNRVAHAWPISYVNRGEDATVNWPNLDFKFKNNTQSPVFIITYFYKNKMAAEIWGPSLGKGITIELESVTTKSIPPPSHSKMVLDTSMEYGTSKVKVKARWGYIVETYQVWYQNGEVIKRNLLHTSKYKTYQEAIHYNGHI